MGPGKLCSPPAAATKAGQQPLCFAQGVGVEQARATRKLVCLPPSEDFGEDIIWRRPPIDGQPKRALADKNMAADRLKRLARKGHGRPCNRPRQPRPAPSFESHLRRSQDVTGRVKRQPDTVDLEWLAIGGRFNRRACVQSSARHERPVSRHQIIGASPAEMVGMCVCDDGAVDRAPGVDEKSPLFAVEAKVGDSKQWVFVQGHAIIIDTTAGRRLLPVSYFRGTRGLRGCSNGLSSDDDSVRSVAVSAPLITSPSTTTAITSPTPSASTAVTPASATILTWLCLVDCQAASAMFLVV